MTPKRECLIDALMWRSMSPTTYGGTFSLHASSECGSSGRTRRKQLLGFWAEFFYLIRIRICWRKFSFANIDSGRFPPMAQRYRNDSFWDQRRLEALHSANTNHPLISQHTESKSQKRPLKITHHNKSHSTRPEAYTSYGKQRAHKRTKNTCGSISTNSHKSTGFNSISL